MKRLIILLTLMCLPAEAWSGQFISGNDFFNDCTMRTGISSVTAYTMGVLDALTLFEEALDKNFICLPNGVTGRQAATIVCQSLQKNPSDRHKAASDLVVDALIKSFPCGD